MHAKQRVILRCQNNNNIQVPCGHYWWRMCYEADLMQFMLIRCHFKGFDHVDVAEPLLLGSLLWCMGIICHLSLPLMLWVAAVLPRENIEQKGLRRVTQKGSESKISECFQMQSFLKSRKSRASRTKMKFNFIVF